MFRATAVAHDTVFFFESLQGRIVRAWTGSSATLQGFVGCLAVRMPGSSVCKLSALVDMIHQATSMHGLSPRAFNFPRLRDSQSLRPETGLSGQHPASWHCHVKSPAVATGFMRSQEGSTPRCPQLLQALGPKHSEIAFRKSEVILCRRSWRSVHELWRLGLCTHYTYIMNTEE